MPCNTIQTVTVDLGKVDPLLINSAIQALGFQDYVSYRGGKLYIRGRDETETTRQVKQAYSAEVVKQQAKKMGWQLKQTAPFQYQVVKR